MFLEREVSGDEDAEDTAEELEITIGGPCADDLEISPSNVESIHIQRKDSISNRN